MSWHRLQTCVSLSPDSTSSSLQVGCLHSYTPQPRRAARWPSLCLPVMFTLAIKLTESLGKTAGGMGEVFRSLQAGFLLTGCTGEGEGKGGSGCIQWPCSSTLSSRAVLGCSCSLSVLAPGPLACLHDTKEQSEHSLLHLAAASPPATGIQTLTCWENAGPNFQVPVPE